jgi:hypothetical protein
MAAPILIANIYRGGLRMVVLRSEIMKLERALRAVNPA